MNDKPSFDLVWGAKQIAKEIKRDTRQTFYLLEKGHISTAKKVGDQWVAERGKLREHFLKGMDGG